ncbi:MAG: SsrA-binding protein SmpB [Lentisphaeria bacterium]|nr:SsrA-binding protein SmpB [Lentisphaeria bacterium]
MAQKKQNNDPVLATNKRAFHNYIVGDRYEAGIKLTGTEVKSCRARSIVMQDSYVHFERGEAYVMNLHISVYAQGSIFNHQPQAKRKLLLHGAEIRKLAQTLQEKGGTVIPLKMYLVKGLIKMEIAYCKGKNVADKRETMREEQDKRDMDRAIRNARR